MPHNDHADNGPPAAYPPGFFKIEMREAERICEELFAARVPQSLKDAVARLIDQGITLDLLRRGLVPMVKLVTERKLAIAELMIVHYLDSLAPYQAPPPKGD